MSVAVFWASLSAVLAAAVEKDDGGEVDLLLFEEGESVAVVVLDPIRKLDNKDRGEEFSRCRCCWVVVVVVVKEGQDPYDGRSR